MKGARVPTRASVSLAALRIAVRLSVIHRTQACPLVVQVAEHRVSQASRGFLPNCDSVSSPVSLGWERRGGP